MKKNTHPEYRKVLFIDSSTGYKFVCGSTLKTNETEVFEGKEYPACRVAISSASHPFFTGSQQFVDAEGRVDKFMKRYSNAGRKPAAPAVAKEKATPAAKAKAPAKKKEKEAK
jgi:large subunit ribosomal protein L31